MGDFSVYKFYEWILSPFLNSSEHPMIFTEYPFWIFFLFVIIGYGLLYKKFRLRSIFLFLVSLYFYYKTSGFFFSILLFSTIADFYLGKAIFISKKKLYAKLFLGFSVAINLLILIYFKYAYFFTDSFNAIIGSNWHPINHFASFTNQFTGSSFRVDQILLPVGISFYTFQTMSYSIDIFRKKLSPVNNIFDFGFYVSFFPQLVAGPIVRAADFIPQIHQPYSLTRQEFGMALFWILNGLLKKFLLADYIAVNFVDRVFDNPGMFSGFENLMALYGYSLQVYADFSGYTDIAIGIALILGFRLPKNFNSPYKADNCGEFWKRWHISLSSWLKDYLYIPMGGNRGGSIFSYVSLSLIVLFVYLLSGSLALLFGILSVIFLTLLFGEIFPRFNKWYLTNINIMLTMLIGGLWHGASWNFVLWGGLNGLGIIIYKLWKNVSPWKNKSNWANKILGIIITFNFVTFTRIWFRSGSINSWDQMDESHNILSEWFTANEILNQLFFNFQWSLIGDVISVYSNVFVVIIIGFLIHFIPERWKFWYREKFSKSSIFIQLIVCFSAIFIMYQIASTSLQPFIYFQF
jgi:D-alanyl-lipoteichoic acid acyltransferase DltB (MBOAT superfamily)|tara:strand:+ start:7242 stop:8972 length:1731 start_codon:yes stop_codon:yes gene_type:complete